MAFLAVICFLVFIVFGILGVISAIRRKSGMKRNFLFTALFFALMIVFVVLGSSSSDNSANNEEKSGTPESAVEVNAEPDDTQAAADTEAQAAAAAEAQKKAAAEAEALAAAKVKEEAKAKEEAAAKAEQQAALAQMVKSVDEVEGVTWYQDKAAPEYINENGIFAYFGVIDEQVTDLHLKIQYSGETWIFIRNYVFNIDGQKYEIDPGLLGAERDMSTDFNAPGVWEYHDESLDDKSEIEMLNQLIQSKKTILRLEGDQRKEDRTISAAQKAALKRTLDAYLAAGGKI